MCSGRSSNRVVIFGLESDLKKEGCKYLKFYLSCSYVYCGLVSLLDSVLTVSKYKNEYIYTSRKSWLEMYWLRTWHSTPRTTTEIEFFASCAPGNTWK